MFLFSWYSLEMPSFSQEINVDLNSNENGDLKSSPKEGRNEESSDQIPVKHLSPTSAPPLFSMEQRFAFALRDFLGPPDSVFSDEAPSPSSVVQTLPYIDEHVDSEDVRHSDEEQPQHRDTEEVLNNAACRLRRWRAASRKLRRPRIIDNLCSGDDKNGSGKASSGGHTDLADRLRSLATASNMSASAGELLSLAPPPAAATAPPSPGCLLSPSLADQSSTAYFVSRTQPEFLTITCLYY